MKCVYGLSKEQYSAMLAAQGGVCAICKRRPAYRLHVDHSHATGKIRGLLCFPCNNGLGTFKDNITLMRLATEYLERNDHEL